MSALWGVCNLFPVITVDSIDDEFTSFTKYTLQTANQLLTRCVAKVAAVGVTMMAVVSGFGAASLPHAHFYGSIFAPREDTIAAARQSLKRLQKIVEVRKNRLSDADPLNCPTYESKAPKLINLETLVGSESLENESLYDLHTLQRLETDLLVSMEKMISEKASWFTLMHLTDLYFQSQI
jgi:hypothetical protein